MTTVTLQVTWAECWCGLPVALSSGLYEELHQRDKTIFCPLGHKFVTGTNDLEDARQAAFDAQGESRLIQAELHRSQNLARRRQKQIKKLKEQVNG